MKKFIFINTICFGFFFPLLLSAQAKLQVVEKRIIEKATLLADETFKVSLEKADVKIASWDRPNIEIKLVFSAKHTNLSIAEEELDYMKYSLTREEKEISLANTFLIPAEVSRLKSSLNLVCEIMVPFQSRLDVSTKYGNIEVEGVKGAIALQSEFGAVRLTDVEGTVMLQGSYSNIKGDRIKGTFTCTTDKSEIDMSGMEGNFLFNTSFGNIDLNFADQLKGLSIKSNRTAVTIRPENFQRYSYELSTTHSNIFVNAAYQKMIFENENSISFSFSSDKNSPLIQIQTTYSPVTIKF